MATTPNYGWVMPDPTDFVTNLPADFEAFGDAVDLTVDGIDTRLTDLEVITAEGDLIVGDASGDPVALPIGAAGTVLTSDGDTAEWVVPGGGAFELLSTTNLTDAAQTYTVTGISQNYKALRVVIDVAFKTASANCTFAVKNSGGTAQTLNLIRYQNGNTPGAAIEGTTTNLSGDTNFANTASGSGFVIDLIDYTRIESTNLVQTPVLIYGTGQTGFINRLFWHGSCARTNTTISQIEIVAAGSMQFRFGTMRIYGVN
jgi:hypothetical protein